MLRFLCLLFLTALIMRCTDATEGIPEERVYPQDIEEQVSDKTMEKLTVNFETVARDAEKSNREGIVPTEDIQKLYTKMTIYLDDILDLMKNPNYVYVFLKAKGIDRIIAPNIMVSSEELKNQILILLRILFEVAPTTTNILTPINIVERLLDIYENDNLALKARTIDILNIWLPENPKIQAHVMKLKGLEPFYEQISKLDVNVIHTLLELFNKILNEHLKVRKHTKIQKNKADSENLLLYQRIGLLERMSTPNVCNGLLNIFETTWTFNADDKVMGTIFDLIKNIKQFCVKNYIGKYKAVELFNTLLKYVMDPLKKASLIEKGYNINEIQLVLEDIIDKIKYSAARDEF